MFRKISILSISLVIVVLMAATPAAAYSTVLFCLERSCSAVTVVFGGQTHPSSLNCDNILSFSSVPAGTYSFACSGCGVTWSGSITVDGASTYRISLCPEPGAPCCAIGCGSGGDFRCSGCQGGDCPVKTALGADSGLLKVFWDFRNLVLDQTLVGTGLKDLYYVHGSEMARILAGNPELRVRLKDFLRQIAPLVEQCNAHMPVDVNWEVLAQADELISAFQDEARPELAKDLEKLRDTLMDGELVQMLCR